MSPTVHFVSSLVGAGVVYSLFGNLFSAFVFILSGVLIDLDHVLDYIREHGLKSLNAKNLSRVCYEDNFNKVTIFLHSYEFLLILWIAITVSKLGIVWIAFALGMTLHLIIDQIANNVFPLTYFLTYRWINKFDVKFVFSEKTRKDKKCL